MTLCRRFTLSFYIKNIFNICVSILTLCHRFTFSWKQFQPNQINIEWINHLLTLQLKKKQEATGWLIKPNETVNQLIDWKPHGKKQSPSAPISTNRSWNDPSTHRLSSNMRRDTRGGQGAEPKPQPHEPETWIRL